MTIRSCVAMGFAVFSMLAALPSCSDAGDEGACHVRLAFEGERYTVHSDLSPVPVGPKAATADEVSCTGSGDVLGQVAVYEVQGVPTTTAVAVLENGDAQRVTVYLQSDSPRDEAPSGWPTAGPTK